MIETNTIIDRLINSGILESDILERLKKPEKNFALLGPEGSGLEELLDHVYTKETREDMLKQGYLVTPVNKFTSPETPADVFRNLYRDARGALNTIPDNSDKAKTLKEIARTIPSDSELNGYNFDAAQSAFTDLVTKLKNAGCRTVFVYTMWENLVFPIHDSVKNQQIEIYATLRELSYTQKKISFVVTTPHGLVSMDPLIRSDFLDSFKPFWTAPKLTCEQIRILIEPLLQTDWPSAPETICEEIQAWTFGNPKLISCFMDSLRDHNGDLEAMADYWCSLSRMKEGNHVSNLMWRWCSHFEQIKAWKLRDVLYAIANYTLEGGSRVPDNKDEVTHLAEIGLISYNAFESAYTCCDALALYMKATYAEQGKPPI